MIRRLDLDYASHEKALMELKDTVQDLKDKVVGKEKELGMLENFFSKIFLILATMVDMIDNEENRLAAAKEETEKINAYCETIRKMAFGQF